MAQIEFNYFYNNKPVTINTKYITFYAPDDDIENATIIEFIGDKSKGVLVDCSYEEVKRLIEESEGIRKGEEKNNYFFRR